MCEPSQNVTPQLLFFSFLVVKYYILNLPHVLENSIHFTTEYLIDYLLSTVAAIFEDRNLNQNNFTKIHQDSHTFHETVT